MISVISNVQNSFYMSMIAYQYLIIVQNSQQKKRKECLNQYDDFSCILDTDHKQHQLKEHECHLQKFCLSTEITIAQPNEKVFIFMHSSIIS